MNEPQIDYREVFENLPTPVLLLTREMLMVDANTAYQRVSGRSREELLGLSPMVAFPGNPEEPSATGAENLSASLRRVLESCEPDAMAVQRYDVESADSPGQFEERYWCPVNVPVTDQDGQVTLIIHVVQEVPDLVRTYVAAQAANA